MSRMGKKISDGKKRYSCLSCCTVAAVIMLAAVTLLGTVFKDVFGGEDDA